MSEIAKKLASINVYLAFSLALNVGCWTLLLMIYHRLGTLS
jgi:hypothetical protein